MTPGRRAILFTILLTTAGGLLFACGRPPPATPTKAEATKDLVICGQRETNVPARAAANHAEALALLAAFHARVEDAGYALHPKPCDIRVNWETTNEERGGTGATARRRSSS